MRRAEFIIVQPSALHSLSASQFTLLCYFTHHSHRTWLDCSVDLPSTVKTVNPKQATLLLFSEDPGLVLPQLSLTASQLKVALHVVNVFGDQVDLGQVKTRISAAIDKVSGKGSTENALQCYHPPIMVTVATSLRNSQPSCPQ